MTNNKPQKVTIHRSSKTGEFVTEKYAKNHPTTTEKEVIKKEKK